jgi:carbon starvation protein
MPAMTQFVNGGGPVWAGNLFPFLFITIACGAVSGFHSLISSGTTPKLVNDETDTRFIGYGAMLMESFVAIMALVAACGDRPGDLFRHEQPGSPCSARPPRAPPGRQRNGFPHHGRDPDPDRADIGEKTIISRAGGAPTLAVGMAHIFSSFAGGKALMASGTTSPSCSRRCSSSPPSTRAPAPGGSCCRT